MKNLKATIKKLLKIKKRMHVFAIEFNPLADTAPFEVKINGVSIWFHNLDLLASLKFWKDSKTAFQSIVDEIKKEYDSAE